LNLVVLIFVYSTASVFFAEDNAID